MELLVLGGLAISGLASIVCFIWVLIGLFSEKGAVHGLLGLLCCQIYVFIFGWVWWSSDKKNPVMIIWTIAIIISTSLQLYARQSGMITIEE